MAFDAVIPVSERTVALSKLRSLKFEGGSLFGIRENCTARREEQTECGEQNPSQHELIQSHQLNSARASSRQRTRQPSLPVFRLAQLHWQCQVSPTTTRRSHRTGWPLGRTTRDGWGSTIGVVTSWKWLPLIIAPTTVEAFRIPIGALMK